MCIFFLISDFKYYMLFNIGVASDVNVFLP